MARQLLCFSIMDKARLYGLLLFVASLSVACDQGPCRPESYGKQCTAEGNSYKFCGDDPTQGRFETPRKYTYLFQDCPSSQPVCSTREGTEDPDIICIGERLEPCETEGFVRCESLDQVVLCVPQEDDSLIESRGPCGEGLVCLPPEAGETDWSGGCFAI